ncbi:WD40-repeat-containing domain protein [Russula vinacea]|nr:WD40-repeat-containing domain protein [Russula vinacea]
MSRFVRPSKYRHVFGQPAKKEHGIDNLKVTSSAWDTTRRRVAILPAPSPVTGAPGIPYKLPDIIPLARSHTAPVLDTDWSPHSDTTVASGGEDGNVLIWQVDANAFEGWNAEGWTPVDFSPVLHINASQRKVGQVLWHPAAQHVLASAVGDHTVKLWDLGAPESPRAVLAGHGDAIQSLAFNPTGQLLATTSRDRKLRLFDPRTGGEAGARVVWMGDRDRIATTGFSRMSDRQNLKTITLDQSAGVVMPFWSDNNILFLAGKGDGNIRYYEYESDNLYALDEHKSINTSECEIARAYKLTTNSIEPIAFIVPRKSDSFQSDIFPPAPSIEPSLTSGEFFSGNPVVCQFLPAASGPGPGPTRTATASAPQSAQSPSSSPIIAPPLSKVASEPPPTSATASAPPSAYAQTPVSPADVQIPPSRSSSKYISDDGKAAASAMQEDNDKLSAELREAYAKIRNLELQVESLKANARKAAKTLLDN